MSKRYPGATRELSTGDIIELDFLYGKLNLMARDNPNFTPIETRIDALLYGKTSAIVSHEHAITCLDYILNHEREDYLNWCEESNIDPGTRPVEHVYASALRAFGIGLEGDRV